MTALVQTPRQARRSVMASLRPTGLSKSTGGYKDRTIAGITYTQARPSKAWVGQFNGTEICRNPALTTVVTLSRLHARRNLGAGGLTAGPS